MAPEMAADPAKARSHLIRDQDAAVSAHHRRGTIHEAGGKVGKPFVHEGRAQDHGADADPRLIQRPAGGFDRFGKSRSMARALLGQGPLPARTPRTLTDPDEILEELARVRSQGHAINDQEVETGLRSIAVPVIDARGRAASAASGGRPPQ